MVEIRLKDRVGLFCTERFTPEAKNLRADIESLLRQGLGVEVVYDDIKLMTTSIFDYLFGAISAELGRDTFLRLVKFTPPLECLFQGQLERGIRLRNK